MNKLKFSMKFGLIMILSFLPLLILATNYFADKRLAYEHGQRELEGLAFFKQLDKSQAELVKLMTSDMAWRTSQNPSSAHVQAIQTFTEQLPQLADTGNFDQDEKKAITLALTEIAEFIRQNMLEEGQGQFTRSALEHMDHQIANLEQYNSLYSRIANIKGLANDPQIDTVLLVRILSEKRQLSLSLLSQVFGISAFAAGGTEVSSLTFDSISQTSDRLDANLANLQTQAQAAKDQDQVLKQLVEQDVIRQTSQIESAMVFFDDEFMLAETVDLKPAAVETYQQQQLDEYYAGKTLLYQEIDNRLQTRISDANTSFYTLVAIVSIAVFAVVYLFMGMSYSISMTVNSLANAARKLAEGDTNVQASIRTRDELADAIRAFNQMARRVHDLVESVQSASSGVTKQTLEVEALATQTGEAVNIQLQDTGAITAAISELLAAVAVVSENTSKVIESLESASKQTEEGRRTLAGANQATEELGQEIQLSVEVIDRLSQHSDSINQVLDVIKSIAEQTNLLALNAAIEAARAGEQGRGFAVVADEVRSLAKRTHESTEEIQATITTLQDGVGNAVNAMRRSEDKAARSTEEAIKLQQALDLITQAVEQIHQENAATEQATVQQQSLASQIESSLASISQNSAVTESNVEQSIDASKQLTEHVDKLREMLDQFKT